MNKKKKLGISYLIDLMIISKVGFIPKSSFKEVFSTTNLLIHYI